MSVNFVRDTSGILFSGDSATLSINNTAITDFKTYIDNQNNLKQNVITASNPLSLSNNTLSLNIDTTTLQTDASTNKLKVIGGGTGSSQWTTHASNNIYNNNNIGIGQANQNKALLELYSTNQLLPRILLNGREFNSTNSNIDGVALLCGTNFTDNRQLWIADSSKLVKISTNPILRVGFTSGSTRIDSLSTDGTTNLPTIFGNSSGLTLDGDSYINGKIGIGITNPSNLLEVYTNSSTINNYVKISSNTAREAGILLNRLGVTWTMFMRGTGFTGYSDNLAIPSSTNSNVIDITQSGNVGIGLTNPQNKLDINGKMSFLSNTNYTAPSQGISGGSGDRIILAAGQSNAYPYSLGINGATMWYSVPVSAKHSFFCNGSEMININASNFTINSMLKCVTGFNGYQGDNLSATFYNQNNIGATMTGYNASIMTNGSECIRFTSGQNVGIGLTNPSCKLDVSGNSSGNIVNKNGNK